VLAKEQLRGHRSSVKAIEITAVLDDADRIVPQSPLPEHPAGKFRAILLVDDAAIKVPPARPPVQKEPFDSSELIHPEVLEITGLVPNTFDGTADYRRYLLEKHQ
jgi:hypothetical protein